MLTEDKVWVWAPAATSHSLLQAPGPDLGKALTEGEERVQGLLVHASIVHLQPGQSCRVKVNATLRYPWPYLLPALAERLTRQSEAYSRAVTAG